MEQYLIDTNVVSDYFSASFSDKGFQFMDSIIDATPQISIITQIELLCWKTRQTIESSTLNFISDSLVFNINNDVIKQCVNIRKGKKIKTPDAIIAATALAYDFILVTNNTDDFKSIEGLKIVNPHQL